ncbi:MAG: hypothetical protein OCC45_02125 [Desulfotalea sp.]
MKIITLAILICFSLGFSCLSVVAEEKTSSWGKAADEVAKAAEAVGDATEESWKQTKEKSSEIWNDSKDATNEVVNKTTEESLSWWESVKKKIHDLTGP